MLKYGCVDLVIVLKVCRMTQKHQPEMHIAVASFTRDQSPNLMLYCECANNVSCRIPKQ
jgi:hypothetical protein